MKTRKVVKIVNSLEAKYMKYSDDELKEKTTEFKQVLLENKKTLSQILPEAYALVREGTKRVTGKRLYDVQIIGGFYLNQRKIAEVKAGEGKTLIQGLPAYLNALTGKGVHMITTNEYLAKRDFNVVGKILEFLGLTVGLIYHEMDKKERKEAYKKDVTYGTNTEFGFDYLRDNIAYDKEELVQRSLNCAIIDEADSILLDEAQTPMIISEKKIKVDSAPYIKADEFVKKLNGITVLKEEVKNKKQVEEIEKYDYVVYDAYKNVDLTLKGVKKAEKEYGLKNLYETKNIEIINYIRQALRANKILRLNEDYIIKDDKILLIDKFTGRIMYGKKYTNGLHEAVEAKENIEIKESSKMLASITTQNYFKMYKKISGMTGTAKESEKEFNDIYLLEVREVPMNKKSKRCDKKDRIYVNCEQKYNAIVEEAKQSNIKGQPVLIGTTSIEKSELLSNLLSKSNVKHNVLNAKNNEEEAKIVANAGNIRSVTIATNMAGRGTNILLGGEDEKNKQDVIKVGGLKVIGTEKHESSRIDEQLRGRSGRQGEVGESIFYLSLDDEIIRIYGKDKQIKKYKRSKKREIKDILVKHDILKAQKEAENRNYYTRRRMVQYDDILNIHKEIIYKDRKKVLEGKSIEVAKDFISYFCNKVIEDNNDKAKKVIKSIESEEKIQMNRENINEIIEKVKNRLLEKEEELGNQKLEKVLRTLLLKIVDENWTEHLEKMEDLKLNIELRAYGGHDPLREYEKEGKTNLDRIIDKIKMNFVNQVLFNANYE